MSGASRRMPDEGSHTSSSRHPLDDSSLFPSHSNKLPQSLTGEYRTLPFEQGQETRLTKGQRIEARDSDRKSSSPSIYHQIPMEIRSDFRESKDNKDSHIESRETKEERREIYAESRMDFQGDIERIKEVKSDREVHTKFNVESETEKCTHVTVDSHLTRNESKEAPKVKRQTELSFEGLDHWRTSDNSHTSEAAGKGASTSDKREFQEGYRSLAESKVDMRVEERLKEKDRKRKEEKHKDWGEREKDRNDHGSNLQAIVNSNDPREILKEQREIDRPEKDIKNALKDKERSIDGEREQNKREISNASDREIIRNDKVMVVASVKMSGQESPSSEQKRGKDVDGWKGNEKDGRDKKRDRDFDGEIEKHEKRVKIYEKDLDNGSVEGEGGSEKDKESPGYGVQQRRRMLRSRGNPQVANREPRFRTRARDNEGSQVKSEVSSVIYKVGECMQELIKLWTEFELSKDKATATDSPHNGPILEIRIPAEHVAATNRQVRGGQLWGTDVYTYDSDLVAVLMHTGYCRPTASPPPPAIQELHATVRVLPPQDCYISTLRNNVRSRSWGAAIGCSFKIERCCIVKKGGGSIDLEPCLNHISVVEPTLAPVSVERTMTTRSATSNALRQQRFMREVTIQYNLCNEPWIKYSISIVADKGLKKPLYTSARLKKGEVLYLETHSNRYELCFIGERTISNGTMEASHCQDVDPENSQNHNSHHALDKNNPNCDNIVDIFRWSRCKTPLPQLVMRSIGIPLPVEHLEVLSDHLDWEDVQWTQTGLWIAGKEYQLARVHFLS